MEKIPDRSLHHNVALKLWLNESGWAAPLRWLYALTQLAVIAQQAENLKQQTEDLKQQTEDLKQQTEDLKQQTDVLLKISDVPFNIETHFQSLLPMAERRVGTVAKGLSPAEREVQFYTYFSEIGGEYSQKVLKQQHEFYLSYLPLNSKLKFLDIGCGSGELLAFLESHGIAAMGIDLEEKEVERVQSVGLSAVQADAITFLNQSDTLYSGISMIQVIEHIPNEAVVKLLDAVVERLEPGGMLLVETLNMRHPLAFNSFYVDPTHIRPVPSDYLGFLMEWVGLVDITLLYSVPVWIPGVHNQDISRIYMNYTLIGRKPSVEK